MATTVAMRDPGCEAVLGDWLEAHGRDPHPARVLMWSPAACGVDEIGLWLSLALAGVEQRMRWIPSPTVDTKLGFWLADTPCTQAFWSEVMGQNPSSFQSARRPVENVTLASIHVFLDRLRDETPGLQAWLPTEAQWDHACRAGARDPEPGAHDDEHLEQLDHIAWFASNCGVDWDLGDDGSAPGGTREVGLKQANAWGLYDMLGNVWERCMDGLWDRDEPIRGGSWRSPADQLRADARGLLRRGERRFDVGFRLVLTS